jgi:kynureninase
MLARADCLELDEADPLAGFRARFALPQGTIYLDGNSLGALPAAVPARLQAVANVEWGRDLIGSWNSHHWIEAPARVGDKIARIIGAGPGEVLVADSTSVNLFKLLCGALSLRPGRRTILSESGNFPTDLYMAQGVAGLLGERARVEAVPADAVADALDDDVAVLLLTHVHYKTARRWDMAAMTAAAHARGAVVLWDLSHSAGAVQLDLAGCEADLAVGCGYKYLNGGPGAPAYLYVAERHQAAIQSPLSGWMGHAAPFDFDDDYRPAAGIGRFACGTPSILAMAALEAAVDLHLEADAAAIEAKSRAMADLLIRLVEQECAGYGLRLVTPRDAGERGSHVSFAHPDGYAIMQALIERGVIGDFRAPDILRFGLTPLYLAYADLWDGVAILRQVLESGSFREARFNQRQAVT